jgi:hypothetical protein
MRTLLVLLSLSAVSACHTGGQRTDEALRITASDSAWMRRVCESPDSVIAGKKECVLLDQGRPRSQRGFPRP